MVTRFHSARCLALATPFPKGTCVTPPPTVTLCRPTSGVWQGIPEHSLSSPCREKNTTLGRGLLCVPAASHTTQPGTLRGVRRGTPDSGCPWHPRAQPAYTHLTLGSMSELFAARHGRSAWETVREVHAAKTPLLDSLESLKVSQLSRVRPSRTLAHLLVRPFRSGLCSEG